MKSGSWSDCIITLICSFSSNVIQTQGICYEGNFGLEVNDYHWL